MAYGAAAGSIVKLIQKLIGQHGVRKGMSMAKKLGFPTKKINQAAKKLGSRRSQMTNIRGGMSQGAIRTGLEGTRRHWHDAMRRQIGTAAPVDPKIAKFFRGPADARRSPIDAAKRMFGKAQPVDPAMSRRFSDMAGMRRMPRPKVPGAYRKALKGTPLMNMLKRVHPENRGQALKLLMQMGLLGAGGAVAHQMISEREGGV
jgi:hypothetical protein